ncbi:uncharacterized protein LOC124813534 [Hydra vulgaris]|uniref:uncharacterized protein LOC124813534 n=1 Tax=Hydra vulgaris TaxID=6087 RepID=UPI001F5EA1AF|nr:uncharacterized protein LOC124813534 [Hydra vulgaris]XP_047136662.1 uncharacterized protein LOC124813534 [Hydra vulgaris]
MMVIQNHIALLLNQHEKQIKGTTEGVLNRVLFALPGLIVKVSKNGATNVHYIKTHNHTIGITNTMYQPIPDNVKKCISAKLSIGVSVNKVYQDLREGFGDRQNRNKGDDFLTKSHLLTKKNISDINRTVKKGCRLHPDDSTSTFLLVQKLKSEEFNSILVFKPQGQQTIIGPKVYDDIDFNKDSFVIAIQTKHQLSMFEKHASQIVCIDSTHCTNQYAFPLVTLLVRDDFKRGYPVAFLISNHANEQTITPFLEEIKKRCSSFVKVNAVMTDDDSSGWNAFCNVFGDVRHLLCKWHVKRAWRSKLSLAGPAHLQEEVYKILETIIDEKDPQVFLSTMNRFIKVYEHKSPNFIKYFVTYYASRHIKWASCYRNFQHADTDTNMLCESFHNKLKTVYMERRPNKRLDDLINLLLKIEEDSYWRYKRDNIYLGTISLPKYYKKRHEKGMLISDNCVVNVYQLNTQLKANLKI